MKNIKPLFFLVLVLCGFGCIKLSAAEEKNVSTEPMLKNILLEEYTAIHCSYCPDGHFRADNLKRVLGNRFNVMAVHAGSLAIPSGNELDFRNHYGEELYKLSGEGGMPSGAINRSIYPDYDNRTTYSYGRGDWSLLSKMIRNDTAEVNLWAKALIDTAARTISIDVEAFYTQSVENDKNHLHIAILENNLITRQTGSYEGSNYVHKHVLRDLALGLSGAVLEHPVKGTFFKHTYTYNIPETYNNTIPALGNLEVLVFISKDSVANVLNSISVSPEFPGKNTPLAIKWGLTEMSDRYIYPYLTLGIENLSMEKITSIEVDLTYNGVKKNKQINLDIASHTYGQCTLALEDFLLKKVNIYKIEMKKLNGKEYFKEAISGQFYEPVSISSPKVTVEFTTDAYSAEENAYYIRDDRGNIIFQKSDFSKESGVSTLTEHVLEKDKNYSLEVRDTFLDGLSGANAKVRLLDKDGKQLFATFLGPGFGEIYSFAYKTADIEENRLDISRLSVWPNPAKDEIFIQSPAEHGNWAFIISDLQGRILYSEKKSISDQCSALRLDVSDLPSGLYILTASCGSKKSITKFHLIK